MIEEAGSSTNEIEEIYRLTTVATVDERFVLPPYNREVGIEALRDPLTHKGESGLGCVQPPGRGE